MMETQRRSNRSYNVRLSFYFFFLGHLITIQSINKTGPSGLPSAEDLAYAAAAAGGVTAARFLLLSFWEDFKTATDVSNAQVLKPLSGNPLDIVIVSALPALSEELLFRGALVPAVYPDYRGVLISGLVFGALHVNGGRNAAFGAWAAAVGCVYGGVFLATGNLLVPMIAHLVANYASATLWLSQNERK